MHSGPYAARRDDGAVVYLESTTSPPSTGNIAHVEPRAVGLTTTQKMRPRSVPRSSVENYDGRRSNLQTADEEVIQAAFTRSQLA